MRIASFCLRNILPLLFLWPCHGPLAAALPQGGEGIQVTLKWNDIRIIKVSDAGTMRLLSFDGAVSMEGYGTLPAWSIRVASPDKDKVILSATLSDAVYMVLTPGELLAVPDPGRIPGIIEPVVAGFVLQGQHYSDITLLPFRKNPGTGAIERLLSFDLCYSFAAPPPDNGLKSGVSWAANSVLASGTWYKFAVTQEGIYRISYDDLKALDINPSDINPLNIRIFSNGGGMVPESNSTMRTDDLRENAIVVIGGEDGVFNTGDYILFFGESPDRWTYDSQSLLFRHQKNIYSDKTYYFLTFDQGPGKRMMTDQGTTASPTNYISKFNDYAFYEQDNLNLIKSGREWYDQEYFDVTTSREYQFVFPNIDHVIPAIVTAVVAARSTSASSSFDLLANNQQLAHISIQAVSPDFLQTYARQETGSGSFNTSDPVINVKLNYNRLVSSAIGYLNYIEVNAMRALTMSGNQMRFRSTLSAGPGKVVEFQLTTQGQPVNVWDVTETGDAAVIATAFNAGACTFRLATDNLREFIAFDGNSYFTPEFTGRVDNQNLHGIGAYDYVIVSYPAFMPQAEQLADFHRQHNGFNVLVTTADKVYNEFSSGAQDISAIRDFMKMMFDKSGGESPDYLLLFGDASYDYKDRVPDNMNLVPTYESPQSLDPIDSYATDDYFVLLEPNEGQGTAGSLDMGVGRLPVQTSEDAAAAVEKIVHYAANSDSVKNDWRNVLCFVADDEDGNLHLDQVEDLTNAIAAQHPVYNIDKIYLDAYKQISTPGGQRIPDVNDAINKRVKNGALLVNYTGHGGEVGWAHERVLEVADINSWTNIDNMPVFVTATCEFSRYDDPERVSAGELVFLNPKGGGIALFTTARPTFASTNFALASSFYNIAFQKQDGHYLKLGDLIRLSKNNLPSSPNTRKFVLLGDPALMMAYPQLNVATTSINGNTTQLTDTLQALSLIEITGEVQYDGGVPATDFNGEVFTTVFDKPMEVQTFGDNGSPVVTFALQKNQIYSGKVNVENGQFSFSFIVPKDISYDYGNGKISYYARSPETDANGYDNSIVIGGFNPLAAIDEEGPEIELYMNDRNFVSGSITDQNPMLLADLSDESGINTVGNGIGHDITAILDDNSQTPMILNEYYVADLNTYKSGVISYPLNNLSEGRHHLTLKVWDVYNNSSEAVISFVVSGDDKYNMLNLYNYPNPFKTTTTFSFETNRTNSDMKIQLHIFNMYGRLVKNISKTLYISGYRSEPVIWDGTDDAGSKCSAGMYVYRIIATLPDGTQATETAKLVLLKDGVSR
jgi:hypothetical protein